MPHVAIIIVNYNGEADTRECLLSLKQIATPDFSYSVIVVDNGSKQVLDIPAPHMPADSVILRSDTNLGFTDGNNLGIRHALEKSSPDYFLLLNNDTTVDPHFLSELLKTAQMQPNVGMIAPKIYFSPGREFHKEYPADEVGRVYWYAGGSVDWANLDSFHRGVDEVDRGHFETQKTSDFATGCCVLIPRVVIDQVKLLDSRYFLYLEDLDWSVRVRRAGFEILFCPTAVIWHKNAGSSGGSGSSLQHYYLTRNRLFFFLKYGNWRTRLTLLRFAAQLLLHGSPTEKKAVSDWMFGRMGKQAIV